jgi:hypothetical protein
VLLDNLLEYGQSFESVRSVFAEADVENDAVWPVFFDGIKSFCLEVVSGDYEVEWDNDSGSPTLMVEALANASEDIGVPFVIDYEDAALKSGFCHFGPGMSNALLQKEALYMPPV